MINSKSGGLLEAIQGMTGGKGAAVVFDGSGMLFGDAVEAAALDGRLPVVAASPDGLATFSLRSLYRKRLRVQGIDTLRIDAVGCAKLLAQLACQV